MALEMRTCPGCGLEMPRSERSYDRKFNASAECWSLFEEVKFPPFFGQVGKPRFLAGFGSKKRGELQGPSRSCWTAWA